MARPIDRSLCRAFKIKDWIWVEIIAALDNLFASKNAKLDSRLS
jgi:hypothetical protein